MGLDPITTAILLMLLGCALVLLEVFIPSGGILGLLSGLAILASIFFAFRYDTTSGLVFILFSVLAIPGLIVLAFKIWPHTPMGKAFLGELPSEEETKPVDARRSLVGRLGVARSKMLPSGSIQVDDRRLDAVSVSGAIEPGEYVIVMEVRGNRVAVRSADEDEINRVPEAPEDLLSRPLDELGFEPFDESLG